MSRPGSRSDTLGIATQIFVLSLPRRSDRRQKMETLRRALGLRWTYIDAIEASDEKVSNVMEHVRQQREKSRRTDAPSALLDPSNTFRWPDRIDLVAASDEFLSFSGSDLWATNHASGHWRPLDEKTGNHFQGLDPDLAPTTLSCATGNDSTVPYTPGLPEYKILSPAKIACWYSHWSIIHRIANDGSKPDVSVILEDDVDMEWDIHERLRSIWDLLPRTWDIVFLGHCWSDESQKSALQPNPNASNLNYSPNQRLHPSSAPKCTHAYALSPSGARRLWLHLRYPPFAYSRALDQAYAWLVAEGRMGSYSIVPSVVVQQKSRGSDITSGNGSDWRETLAKAVLGS